jgi:hypothetical protein
MKKERGILLIFLFYLVLLIYLFFYHEISSLLYSYVYAGILFILITYIFLESIFNLKLIKKEIKRVIYFFIFLPIAVFPLLKCYFKIPYIFCNNCPNRCPWGYLRSFTVPSFLLVNIDNRRWCFNNCPLGYLQDLQKQSVKKRIKLPKEFMNIRYIILVIVIFFFLLFDNFTFKSIYSITLIVLIIAAIIFISSFFIHRLFCNYICPIGAAGELCIKVQNVKK